MLYFFTIFNIIFLLTKITVFFENFEQGSLPLKRITPKLVPRPILFYLNMKFTYIKVSIEKKIENSIHRKKLWHSSLNPVIYIEGGYLI